MFDIVLRRVKDQISDPVSRLLPSWISPNYLTFLAFVSGLASCYNASSNRMSWSLLFWLLNRALDCLDGSVARRRGASTELGGFLDLLGDFIVYSLIPISTAYGQEKVSSVDWRAVAVLEASFHVNNFVLFYIAAVASAKKAEELTSVTMMPALVEGFESGMIFTGMLVWPEIIGLWAWGMAVAVLFGITQRILVLVPILRRLDDSTRSKDR